MTLLVQLRQWLRELVRVRARRKIIQVADATRYAITFRPREFINYKSW